MRRLAITLALVLSVVEARGQSVEDPETFFETKIRPVLAGTCFKCHGGKKTNGGLRVDSRDALTRGGDSGPAVVPGDPEGSLVVRALRRSEDQLKMPPDRPLPESVASDFEAWIKQGALWPKDAGAGFTAERHWAFEPVKVVDPPPDPSGWSAGPIDRFIAAKWRDRDLRPVGRADRQTLLRRVTFDLIGLPPTPEELAAFGADDAPGAYARVVDRLLADPHYGERWGRHWMDVVRYADTAGDNADYPVPEARQYRDYIIDAFNTDVPYDRFVREQLAGDVLARRGPAKRYAEQVIATGFLALSRKYATAPEELWHLTLEDAIETTGRTFLGLTLRCARCHDHKFDPVTTEDYYALYGIFASTRFAYAGSEEFQSKNFPRAGFPPLLPPDQAAPRLSAHERRMSEMRAEIERISKDDPAARLIADVDPRIDALGQAIKSLAAANQDAPALKAHLATLEHRRDGARGQLQAKLAPLQSELSVRTRWGLPPDLPGAYGVSESKPVDEAIQLQGDPARRGPVARRAVPKFLAGSHAPAIAPDSSGRLELADWLTRPEHPLTARVMVNRIWQHHFGRGIVGTPSNFGLRGEEPTHPELLDWLASRFIASGWSIKALHRLIVLSATYQLASNDDSANSAQDPSNRLLWRHHRTRLDAEALRDAMLAVSGRLDLARPGPHPFPPIAQWNWTQHNAFKAVYPSDHRSVYLMTQRLQKHPYLALFDAPDTNTTTDQRTSSTVPLQALFLMNSPFVHEQGRALAGRLIAASSDPTERIVLGHTLAFGRPPTPADSAAALEYVGRYQGELAHAGTPAEQVETEAWSSYARILLTSNEFLYVD
jgi:hypothetical protein